MSELLNINVGDPMPLYVQLERAVRFAIATGKLRIGDQLPTVRELAVELKINANTVARVYTELERSGVVETRRGVGTFIRARHFEATTLRDRERQFEESLDRFLAESGALGFSLPEVISRLEARSQKEKRKNG
jgi:GntR family transcriptional regulator